MFALRNDQYANTTPLDAALLGGSVVNSLVSLYTALIKAFKSLLFLFALAIISSVILLPLAHLFGLWLSRKRSYLVKSMKNKDVSFRDAKQYVEFKLKLEKMSSGDDVMKKVSELNLKKVPYIVRYPVSQMKHLSSTIITYKGWLASRLNTYNNEQFKSEQKIFSFKSENDLWKNRNSAYTYWM